MLSSLSLLASSEGAACNDARTARLVEAARMEEGAACNDASAASGAVCNDASAAPGAACNDASAAPRSFQAKQCFKSCLMSMGMAPNFKASNTVVATLYLAYRCHAAVCCRFGLHARKRMPSPSSAFTSMADQKASTPFSTCVEVNDALRQAQRVVGVGWALIRDGLRCTVSHVAPPEAGANASQG